MRGNLPRKKVGFELHYPKVTIFSGGEDRTSYNRRSQRTDAN